MIQIHPKLMRVILDWEILMVLHILECDDKLSLD